MPKDERFLPPQITRYDYWRFFPPRSSHQLAPTFQRLGECPELGPWTDLPPGEGALDRHTKAKFLSDLNESPYQALYDLVLDNKLWKGLSAAQEVLKCLSVEEQATIARLHKDAWPERSKRPERRKKTWKTLFKDIASDIRRFEGFCKEPPQSGVLKGIPHKAYKAYSKQAIWLLGGGKLIPPSDRGRYQDLLDPSSTLLTPDGRLPNKSIYDLNWLTLTSHERREAKKRTIHWFQHSLRDMREYRNRRSPIPWSPECEQECRRIHEKILKAPF